MSTGGYEEYTRYERAVLSGLAEIIRSHRARLNLSQSELAEKLGCGRNYIIGLESGTVPSVSIERLLKLAIVFGIPLWQMLRDSEELGKH